MGEIDNKRVLITGANGFVGRALCQKLNDDGYKVTATVRGGEPVSGLNVNTVNVGEIDGQTDWRAVLTGCEFVVHLAARVHFMHDVEVNPLVVYRTVNTDATLNLARQAADAGIKRFIFASTIKVNGEGRETAYTESDLPNPIDAYAISKWEAEQGLRELITQTGLQVVTLRIPLVYGPGVRANFLTLIQAVERRVPLPFGRIQNRRSLIYLGNLVDAICRCLMHPAAANKTFLVSDDHDVSTAELIRSLSFAMGRRPMIFPLNPGIMRLTATLAGKKEVAERLLNSLQVDIDYAKRILDWSPPYSFETGIEKTVKHFLGANNTFPEP